MFMAKKRKPHSFLAGPAMQLLTRWCNEGQPSRQEIIRLVLDLEQRIAELEPLAEIGRKVSGSRGRQADRDARRTLELAVVDSVFDLLEDGEDFGTRGLSVRVHEEFGRSLKISERTIRRVLKQMHGRLSHR
jgi:hypothetical protein